MTTTTSRACEPIRARMMTTTSRALERIRANWRTRSTSSGNARKRRERAHSSAFDARALARATTSIAIVGAGFAGVALAHELLAQSSSRGKAIEVTLIDARGLARGASGASAGILHARSSKGKTIWRGIEGVEATMEMIAHAESARESARRMARAEDADASAGDGEWMNTGERRNERVKYASGIVRPARTTKQGREFHANVRPRAGEMSDTKCLTTLECEALCPGIAFADDVVAAEARGDSCAGALYMPQGIIVDASRYVAALWDACALVASRGPAGARAKFRLQRVERVGDLFHEFDDVCLCCGAEFASLVKENQIPITLQGAHVLVLKPERETPGILGTTYVAPLGVERATCGPTKERDATVEDARRAGDVDRASSRGARAEAELRENIARAYPPAAAWDVARLRYAVRANPPKTSDGALPLAGRVAVDGHHPWFIAGLGARGLVYHALLARWVARAVLDDDASAIPQEILRDARRGE